ncbi:MAG: hypothetical protein O2992_14700 [Gemmatimonadetes bacterium]|nr:hypothetical protein [Gemmatimonadota bacterium]
MLAPRARSRHDEVASSILRIGDHVADAESHRLEPGRQRVVDGALSGRVEGAAVDVDDLFEQCRGLGLIRLDSGGDSGLHGVEVLGGEGRRDDKRYESRETDEGDAHKDRRLEKWLGDD